MFRKYGFVMKSAVDWDVWGWLVVEIGELGIEMEKIGWRGKYFKRVDGMRQRMRSFGS